MPSWYVTSHQGQLSLLSSVTWEMSTSQGAVELLLSGWERNHRSGITLVVHHRLYGICWWRSPAVEHWSLADMLLLSCARLVADVGPLMWVSHPL